MKLLRRRPKPGSYSAAAGSAHGHKPRKLRHNLRLGLVVLVLPLNALAMAVWLINGNLSSAKQLQTEGKRAVAADLEKLELRSERQFAYYQVRPWQTPASLAQHFGVTAEELAALNPGPILPGMTIKIPPVRQPLTETVVTPLSPANVEVVEEAGAVHVRGKASLPLTITTIPELANYLTSTQVLSQTAPRRWLLLKPLVLEGNIRLNVTGQTLDLLELRSQPHNIVCLCLEDAQMLIKNVTIRSLDPASGQVDSNFDDERSYIRARRSSRLDIIGADISYLGNNDRADDKDIQRGGGTAGVSWRIPDDGRGVEVATGWVEGSRLHHNYVGAYSFGANGMVWRGNQLTDNITSGLSLRGDSAGSLIEDNLLQGNGKHGLELVRGARNNQLYRNRALANRQHGYSVTEESQFNLLEANQATGNASSLVISQSHYNAVRGNRFEEAVAANVRVERQSRVNLLVGNSLRGGSKGFELSSGASFILIKGNTVAASLAVAADRVNSLILIDNQVSKRNFRLRNNTNTVIGPTRITRS
ncbi:MAG TPA: right-handed parallel beta-helix repeat-containing protein [Candidatus Saccharimonadales bacterium]|nr:right-handed parallel beta-helix repeat-containing protein [Candidatus Saccharimonadales bacterium]